MPRTPKDSGQNGAAGLLVVIALLGVCLLTLMYMGRRADDELRAEGHEELVVDKLKVKTGLKAQSDCRNIDLNAPCALGTTISLPKRTGGELVAANGSTKIGKWNVRIECLAKSPNAFFVTVARLDGNSSFLKDPLTGKPLSWAELMPLKDACSLMGSNVLLMRSDACYGAIQGIGELPPEIGNTSGCLNPATCKYKGKYCIESQRDFPICPTDFQSVFRYVDRYGWGGIDYSKYTVCSRLN